MNKSNNVFYYIKRLICVDIKLFFVTIFASIRTSLPFFLSALIMSILSKEALDSIISGNNIIVMAILIIFILILLRVFVIWGYYLNSLASEKLSAIIQIKIIKKWLHKKSNYKYLVGDVTTRLIDDCSQNISDFYFQGIGLVILEPIVVGILGIIVIWYVDYRFLILSIIFGVLSTILSLLFTDKIKSYQSDIKENNSQISVDYLEFIKGFTIIKSNNIQDEKIFNFKSLITNSANKNYKITYLNIISEHFSGLLNVINIIICFIIGAKLNELNGFNFSSIIIIIQMQPFVSSLISKVGDMYNYLCQVSVSAKRVFELIDEVILNNDNNLLDVNSSDIELKLKDVSLDMDKKILDKITVSVKKGEIIVLVGKSGCGKTSLLNVIAQQNNDYTGSVEINGIDIKNKNVLNKITLFEQFPILFNKSILENIQIASNNIINGDKLEEYSKMVGLYEFISDLKDGYETIINEHGTNVSGGQKQRIALMRALICQSPILLFDEPTSSLDYKTEDLICNTLNQLKKDKLIIISSHRSKVFSMADRIYVIENGLIIDSGTYQQLILRNSILNTNELY